MKKKKRVSRLYFPNLYERKKTSLPIKDKVYLTSNAVLDISSASKPVMLCVAGKTGTGKTAVDLVVGDQFRSALLFDPKAGVVGAPAVTEFMGIAKNWTLNSIRGSGIKKDKAALKMNVREVGASSVNVLCLRKELSSDVKLRRVLQPFFSMSENDPRKTFDNFEKVMKDNRLDFIFDELSVIFDEKDKGLSLDEICNSKRIIDIHELDADSRAVAVLIESIFNYRRTHYLKEKMFIGCDEMHNFCKSSTAIGTAMGYVFSTGRSFGICGLVSGTNVGDLEKHIKANISVYILFESDFEKDRFFREYGVDLDFDSLNYLKKKFGTHGNCFIKAEDLGFMPPIPIHIDINYYQEIRKGTEDVVVNSFEDYL